MPEVPATAQAGLPPPAAAPAPTPVAAPKRFELPPEPKQETKQPAPVAAPAEAPKVEANTAEEAPAADPEAKPETEVTPEQEAKRAARRAQNKLEKAFRVRAEALARAELAEKQLAEERAKAQPVRQPGEPTLEQFDYDPEKYAQAKAEFARKQAAQDLSATQVRERQRANQQKLVAEWEEKVDKSTDKYEDFQTVVGDLQPNTPFVAAIMKVPNGPDVAYKLGKNPKEAERIAQLEPLEQVVEIALLSARLSAEPAKPIAPSKAPAPIAPLTGTTPVATNTPSESDSMKEWMRKRQKQVHGR